MRAWVRQPPGVSMEMSRQPGVPALPVDRVCAQPLYYPTVPAWGQAKPVPGEASRFLEAFSPHLPAASPAKGGSGLDLGTP